MPIVKNWLEKLGRIPTKWLNPHSNWFFILKLVLSVWGILSIRFNIKIRIAIIKRLIENKIFSLTF